MSLKRKARVSKVDKNNLEVEFLDTFHCKGCKLNCKVNEKITLTKNTEFKEGEIVELRFSEKKFLILIFITFLIPSLLFILTIFVFRDLKIISFLLAVLILLIYFLILAKFFKKSKIFDEIEIHKI